MTLIFTHDVCLEHRMQPAHPESPDRLAAVLARLDADGLRTPENARVARPGRGDEILRAHPTRYVEALEQAAPATGLVAVDPDTSMGPRTLDAARFAVGAVAEGVEAVLGGQARRVFCATRPPGHHAEVAIAMGFCFFNSIAIGALKALADGEPRVAVLDFDVHHGNGTVDIFREREEVLVCSTFQHPHYPNRQLDVAAPNIVSSPLPAGSGSREFRAAVERDWLPALAAHRPTLILVSAGFDAHAADPLGDLTLTEDDFTWVTRFIVDAANRFAEGRIVATLEGGYDLDALAASAAAHVAALNEN